MKKKLGLKMFFILFLWISVYGFYKMSEINYKKHLEIKETFVSHPELLPTKDTAKYTAMWFKNFRADLYWLQAIQYIWWNAINSEYKKYLFAMLDLITELNPYFEHPYIIGQLLLPSHNERYEDLDKKWQEKHINEWIELGLKWIKNFCDEKKVELIMKEDNLQKVWTEEKYKDPCKSYQIPFNLAFIYFFYKKDPLKASDYYKLTSANRDSLEWAKIMSVIMRWKWWDREKSFFMFLNMATSIWDKDVNCKGFSNELQKLSLTNNLVINEKTISEIEKQRNKIFPKFDWKKETEILADTKCINYLNKAIRELNMKYIEDANEVYKKKFWYDATDAKELFDKKFIKFLPTDFQQYESYGIIYKLDKETWRFDYKMGKYWEN